MSGDTIEFIVIDDAPETGVGTKHPLRSGHAPGKKVSRSVPISVEALKENLHDTCAKFSQALKGIESVGGFELAEVTLQAEVSSQGGVKLIGSLEAGAKAAITLKFAAPAGGTVKED